MGHFESLNINNFIFYSSGAHFTIFVVDLTVMELRDFRKDIPLTDEEYALTLKKSTVSCDVSTKGLHYILYLRY